MAAFVVTDSLKQLIGHKEGPIVFKVEEGAIQRYAQAVGDSNPLHSDIEHAAGSEWGRPMAPPGFTGWPVAKGF
ncbi:MAG: MaoC family dehydratase N-terminal domain-containing protein, partial [Dehalococcoidia bacterium]|nr:MaoC family dehydratase N-terminal domain-containing protein [Dehalococcoidia bacterium]